MRIFKLFDSSGDGYISKTEMQKIMKAFGEEASLDEAEEMVEMADADCDGKVSFDEFKALMKEGDGDVPSFFFIISCTILCKNPFNLSFYNFAKI